MTSKGPGALAWPHPGQRGLPTQAWMLLRAKCRIAAASDPLGAQDIPRASFAWFVIGFEFTFREWSMRQGWARRMVHGHFG